MPENNRHAPEDICYSPPHAAPVTHPEAARKPLRKRHTKRAAGHRIVGVAHLEYTTSESVAQAQWEAIKEVLEWAHTQQTKQAPQAQQAPHDGRGQP
jgi:hypothetical protein